MNTNELETPTIGQGATKYYPQDRYGYVITKVTKTTFTAVRLTPVSATTGHTPASFAGPWPVWHHTYTAEEMATMQEPGTEIVVRKTKQGWRASGTSFYVGSAVFHRDYSY